MYEFYLTIIVKTCSHSFKYRKICFKTCFLFFFINWVEVVIPLDCHYNILEYSQTSMAWNWVWFKWYLYL